MKKMTILSQLPERKVELCGGIPRGVSKPVVQVRIGKAGGPIIQGNVDKIREVAGQIGLAAVKNKDESVPFTFKGGHLVVGLGREMMDLAAQLGDIATSIEDTYGPRPVSPNMGSLA